MLDGPRPVEASKGWQRFQMLRQNLKKPLEISSRQSEAGKMERVAQQRLAQADAQLT